MGDRGLQTNSEKLLLKHLQGTLGNNVCVANAPSNSSATSHWTHPATRSQSCPLPISPGHSPTTGELGGSAGPHSAAFVKSPMDSVRTHQRLSTDTLPGLPERPHTQPTATLTHAHRIHQEKGQVHVREPVTKKEGSRQCLWECMTNQRHHDSPLAWPVGDVRVV